MEEAVSEAIQVFPSPSPKVRLVSIDRPWVWLSRGWQDLMRAPRVGLAYGAVLVVISFIITLGLYLADALYLLLPSTAGFMLVAPALTVGLYETSRRLAAGEPATLRGALGAWRRNTGQLAVLGLMLMLAHIFWIRLAMLLYPLFFTGNYPASADLIQVLFFSPMSLPFLITGTILGAVLAALVFAVAAVSIPMLIDREVGAITAIATSVTAVRANYRVMALWAALIVGFTAAGFVFIYIGLAVTLPLIAHASWHCYKDLVE
jgi:uncharacterized membrane protein